MKKEKCLFCKFISGERKIHICGVPFKPLHETKNTLSFLSIDLPVHEDGHTLVIPKKHYQHVDQIPDEINKELLSHVKLITKAVKKSHDSCNILLNDGPAAGQYIPHAHFHIVPRDRRDGIKIEQWKRKRVKKDDYNRIHEMMASNLKKIR